MRRGFEMRRRAGGHRTVSHESAHDLRMNPGFASHSPAAAHCEQLGISSAHVLDPRAAGSGGAGRCRPPSPHVPHDFAQFGPMYAGFCSHWPCLAHASQLSSASVHASAASAASSASDRAASASAPALARLLAPSSSGGRGGSGSSHEPPTAAMTATASTPTAAADAPNDPLPLPFARASAAAFALGIGAGSVRILPKLVSDLRSRLVRSLIAPRRCVRFARSVCPSGQDILLLVRSPLRRFARPGQHLREAWPAPATAPRPRPRRR